MVTSRTLYQSRVCMLLHIYPQKLLKKFKSGHLESPGWMSSLGGHLVSEGVFCSSKVDQCDVAHDAKYVWDQALLNKKATIHQITIMLATSKNVLFPGHNHRYWWPDTGNGAQGAN